MFTVRMYLARALTFVARVPFLPRAFRFALIMRAIALTVRNTSLALSDVVNAIEKGRGR